MEKRLNEIKQIKVQQQEEESENEMNEYSDLDSEEMRAMDALDAGKASLFWSMKLVPDTVQLMKAPQLPGYMITITHASFGPKMYKDTRTVIMIRLFAFIKFELTLVKAW